MQEHLPRRHPTSIIGPEVQLADDVEIGAYCIIKDKVKIGSGCILDTHVLIQGNTTIGERNKIGAGCIIGGEPQYRAFKEGQATFVEIGNDNVFREYVTINRGTAEGTGLTKIGSNNYFMVGSHVAHDCLVGNNCTIANYSSLAGHVELADGCVLSAYVGIQQRSRIGRLVMMGGHSRTTRDLPPFMMSSGQNNIVGMNLVGLRRAGVPRVSIDALRNCLKILYFEGYTIPNALVAIEAKYPDIAEVKELVSFIRETKIGICRSKVLDASKLD
jgi:UDP-N-acetylglucosamine acyltransferase